MGVSLIDRHPVATLDLHGFSAIQAEPAVRNFVLVWQRRKPGSVLHVVTGKGRGSGGPPVLKPKVRLLLEGPLKSVVREWSKDLDDAGFLILLR